ncbi:MAG: tetratricopeptide repeat protein [Elusimicrobia bacterium]|nr:tetratricopeptide repeat protein [Elusimicrobiota bacterium]
MYYLIFIIIALLIFAVLAKISSYYSVRILRDKVLSLAESGKEPQSLEKAREYEKLLESPSLKENLTSKIHILLFNFYRTNHAGDITHVKRALELGDKIKNNYKSAPFYSDALFEHGNLHFFIVSDLDRAYQFYQLFIDERPDSRWRTICQDRVELIKDNKFNQRALKLYIAAEKFFEEGRFKEALEYLERVLEEDLDFLLTPATLFFIADIYYYKFDDFKSALRYYRWTADDYEGSSVAEVALYKSGELLMKKERWEDAIATYRELIEKYPDSHIVDDARYYIGAVYQNMGKLRKAKNIFSLILGDFPESKWTEVIYHRVQDLNSELMA